MQNRSLKTLLNNSFLIILLTASISICQTAGSVYGFVTDEAKGESLIGANVIITETGQGMATDMNGYYVLQQIPEGNYTLIVSYIGYEVLNKKIIIKGSGAQKLDLVLKAQAVSLSEVDVTAEKIQRKYNITPSQINLSPRMLKAAPGLAEPDLFRTIQALPGVLTTSEFSTGLVIRGGNTDQNLILLDGITVYNPSHLGGVFSNFIVDGVKEANLIKGGYSAEYGGRLSAVLNVLSREGNRNKFEGKMSVSLLSSQTTLEGPIYNGAWLISARRTYFDQIFKNNPNIPPYYFYDFQGHVFSDLSSKDRISLSFYSGLDDFSFDDLGLTSDWGNNTISLSYRRLFSERMVGNFLLATSQFFTNFGLGGKDGLNNENLIDDKTFSANLSYFQSEDLEWRYGLQVKQLG
ncbi:MAG: TonB-dependent receptor, partial [Candidatus Neomarinimicrobiota bacterium]|nr:TonB-dependent receptor [Candidatus Neomarinimicrobiota bacterium]